MTLSRRQFIQIGSATAGAAVVGTGLVTDLFGMTPNVVAGPNTDGDTVVPTLCEMCFWKCGVLAHVKDGRVTKIVGNPDHPLSQGRLCPRGTGGVGLLYDPDRLRTPLMRRDRRGTHQFEAVSWDAALDHVAERLQKVKDTHGPEALAMFSHGCGGDWFKRLVKAYGTGNVAAPSYAQCRGSREAAFDLTFGASVGSPETLDIENTRALTLIGGHLGENMHNTQVQELARAIERGAQLVVVDPRFSTVAGKARWWLPIRPGTDLALLLAWMHVILEEGLADTAFLEKYALGLPQLRRHVQDKTPEWAWTHTSIAPEVIVETARFIAGARPRSIVHPGRRTAWYGDDTQRGRAIAILNALLGNWGREGGFFTPAHAALPPLIGGCKPTRGLKPPPDAPKGVVYPFAGETLAHGLRDASIPGTADYDIKAWLVYGTNLIQALPQPARTVEAIQHLDFMVAVDVLPAEITGWADVVLPECTYLERYDDIQTPGWKRGYMALRQPAVAPMYDSKPGWWIASELGRRLGLGDAFPWADAETYLEARLSGVNVHLSDLRATGVVLADPVPTTLEEGLEPSFGTPSGKIELFSERLLKAGQPPLPVYTPPEEPPPGHFRLLFGRAPAHTFGRTTNNRFLSELMGENVLWINARVARERGLTAGQRVTLVNDAGVRSEPIALRPTERIRADCVYMVHGYGHDSPGLVFARGRGASDSRLMSRVKVDPAMGGTGMNVTFVAVEGGAA